jgi:hypothetical protein
MGIGQSDSSSTPLPNQRIVPVDNTLLIPSSNNDNVRNRYGFGLSEEPLINSLSGNILATRVSSKVSLVKNSIRFDVNTSTLSVKCLCDSDGFSVELLFEDKRSKTISKELRLRRKIPRSTDETLVNFDLLTSIGDRTQLLHNNGLRHYNLLIRIVGDVRSEKNVSPTVITYYLNDDFCVDKTIFQVDDSIFQVKELYGLDQSADVPVCAICLCNKKNALFLPCGHVATCVECANQLMRHGFETRKCVICRSQISSVSKIEVTS